MGNKICRGSESPLGERKDLRVLRMLKPDSERDDKGIANCSQLLYRAGLVREMTASLASSRKELPYWSIILTQVIFNAKICCKYLENEKNKTPPVSLRASEDSFVINNPPFTPVIWGMKKKH